MDSEYPLAGQSNPPGSKKSDGISKIVKKLEIEHGLSLSKNKNSRVFSQITYLFFKDELKLNAVLKDFNAKAPYMKSQWVHKPKADWDTLPQRSSNSLTKQECFNDPQRNNDPIDRVTKFLEDLLKTALHERK
jgi:hypothetical protein